MLANLPGTEVSQFHFIVDLFGNSQGVPKKRSSHFFLKVIPLLPVKTLKKLKAPITAKESRNSMT